MPPPELLEALRQKAAAAAKSNQDAGPKWSMPPGTSNPLPPGYRQGDPWVPTNHGQQGPTPSSEASGNFQPAHEDSSPPPDAGHQGPTHSAAATGNFQPAGWKAREGSSPPPNAGQQGPAGWTPPPPPVFSLIGASRS